MFADSIPNGQRSYYFTLRTVSTTGGQVLGPVGAIIMFAILGDQWTIADCSKVICLAQFLLIPAFGLLWFFNDDDRPMQIEATENAPSDDEDGEQSALLEEGATTAEPLQDDVSGEANTANDTSQEVPSLSSTTCCLGMTQLRFIAASAAISDITCALAQGMSNRYFAIFLLNNLQLHPVVVQILDASSCITGAALLLLAQRASERLGRCPVSIILKLIGVTMLVFMILMQHEWKLLICIAYVLQGSFLGSTQALTRSIVMDHVPSNERAKWSALESINIFGWCGSAALGGMLVNLFHGNVIPVFWFTAFFQVVGILPLVPLIKVVIET